MKTILTIHEKDINPDAPDIDESALRLRKAARGVVFGPDGEVYLLHVHTAGYHKLPGGGVEHGEDMPTAFGRECLEEIGCNVEVTTELGQTIEYRHQFNQKQVSYCYVAKQIGEQGESNLEQGEIDEGHDEVKAKDIDEAIKIMEQGKPTTYDGKFIWKRDLEILREAKKVLA